MLRAPHRVSVRAAVAALALAVTGLTGPLLLPAEAGPAPVRPGAGATAVVAVNPTAAAPTSAGTYAPVTPYRLLDTRQVAGPGPVAANGGTVVVTTASRGGLPSSGVGAVAVTLTVTAGTSTGYLTAYAYGGSNPGTSNVNWMTAGQTVANGAVVPVSADGRFVVRNTSPGTVHVVVDVTGYYLAGKPTAAGAVAPLTPTRVLDTRRAVGVPGSTPVTHLATVHVPVATRGQAAAGANAVLLNLTVTQPTASGYVTVGGPSALPYGGSALNWRAGQTVANLVLAPVDPDGAVALQVTSIGGTAHLVADLVGFVTGGALAQVGATSAQRPYRLVDTRTGVAHPVEKLGTLVVATDGSPRAVTAGDLSAVVVDVVVTAPATSGYLTAWAGGTAYPSTSSLNFAAGQTVAAAVVVPVSADGTISLRNVSGGPVHVVVDLEGVVLGRSIVDAPGWSSEQVPDSGQGAGSAAGAVDVACADGPVCAALTSAVGADGTRTTRVSRWDGASWGVGAPLTAWDATTGATACSSTGLCVAAAPQDLTSQVASSGADGAWVVETPPADAAGRAAVVRDVACPPDGASCVAVGSAYAPGSAVPVPYAAQRGSDGWHPLPVPVTGASAHLSDLACASDGSCVAVGATDTPAAENLVATWDGSVWTTETLPVPGVTASTSAYRVATGGSGDYTLTGVIDATAPMPTRFTAVRSSGSWVVTTVPDPSFAGGELTCQRTGSGCWASSARPQSLGSVPDGTPVTLADGSGPPPTTLSALSCPSDWCEGVAPMLTGLVTDRGVVLDRTLGSWTAGAAPTPPDTVERGLDPRVGATARVSCWSGGCLLVGPYAARSGGQALKADVLLRSP